MENKLVTWLAKELNERGWSQRQLAQKADLSHTTISDVLSGQRIITFDFCAAIAGPLGKQPEELFILAGLLPPKPAASPPSNLEAKINEIYRLVKESRPIPALPAIREGQEIYLTGPDQPSIETLAEDIWPELDHLSRQAVYDYARWRLAEQKHRRNSSGDQSAKVEERDQTIKLIDLLLATHAATPKQRELVITILLKMYEQRWNELPEELKQFLPSGVGA